MANQQEAIYQNYVETFKDVVKPEIFTRWPEMAEGEEMELTTRTRKVGESYSTRVYVTSKGRVIEQETVSWYKTLYYVFERDEDWWNYRKPLGMFHYLNT